MHDATPHISINPTSYNSSLILLLKSYKWWIAGTLLGQIIAILALLILPETYEAKLLLQVGQTTNEPIESVENTVLRMKSLGFQEDIVRLIIKARPDYVPEKVFKELKKISISVIKNTDIVEIIILAPSIAEAIQRGEYYMTTIEKRHHELSTPLFKARIDQLNNAKEHLKMISSGNVTKAQVTAHDPNYTLQLDSNNEAIFWNQQILTLNHALVFPNTRPTTLFEPIIAPTTPISPKKIILFLFGSMIGFGLGLISFVVHSRKPLNI